ncbi:hypothetical protein, conserved [Trypanosoma brucei gambiense DAL972]|uniref:Uncharacterized protein n=2 Tax=Trypanosoma brucei TaxID=5691 RepID=D0A8M7_TRYB9|nr:hypothetical protein, conserved [Trypanosoma brucei gambiense DAL972]RHW68487.1 hypothetical protein DPX39_110073800 [Trypanosoma brucei equiperdum]CBH18028.1 hypothetical protein, conserved [Trypanosoma brucei gambiense DAL972]|eukprot:XP_011780292.1 hypothetical protein, conserved [Trypanosoma brucei gambiense DAL972]
MPRRGTDYLEALSVPKHDVTGVKGEGVPLRKRLQPVQVTGYDSTAKIGRSTRRQELRAALLEEELRGGGLCGGCRRVALWVSVFALLAVLAVAAMMYFPQGREILLPLLSQLRGYLGV